MAVNSLREMTADFVKLERFEGGNFIRWQKKLHFLLSSLNVAYVLTTAKPAEPTEEEMSAVSTSSSQPMQVDGDSTTEKTTTPKENEISGKIRKCQKWVNDDYICLGHILNALSDSLFDIYQHEASAKELWEKLEARYMTEDATSKKFLVSRFLNYTMIDDKSVVEQFNELEKLYNTFKQYNMNMDETIVVSAIIEKLPSSWKDMKRSLKHKKEDITLENLSTTLRLEENYRSQEENKGREGSKILMVEDKKVEPRANFVQGQGSNNNTRKRNNNGLKPNKKRKGNCFHCNKPGHFKSECRALKKEKGKEKFGKSLRPDI